MKPMSGRTETIIGALVAGNVIADVALVDAAWARMCLTALGFSWFTAVALLHASGEKLQQLRAEFIRNYGYDPATNRGRAS